MITYSGMSIQNINLTLLNRIIKRIIARFCIDNKDKVDITDRMICFESIIVIVLQLLVNTKNNDNHVDVLNILIQLRVISCIKIIFINLWFCIV